MAKDKITTNFSLLLRALHVSGTELAEVLHIDSSLISKWRTNKRKFRSNSPIFEELVAYMLSLDAASDYNVIRGLLVQEYPDANGADRDRLTVYLKKWLVSAVKTEETEVSVLDFIDSSQKAEQVQILKFHGPEGKRQCVLSLLRLGSSMEENQELWCVMDNSQGWFTEDAEYLDLWEQANLRFLEGGNEIHVLHPMNRRSEQIATSLLAWLPLYLTGKVDAYFKNTYAAENIRKSAMLLKNHAAMVRYSGRSNSSGYLTYLTDDKEVVQDLEKTLQSVFRGSSPCFRPYYQEQGRQYMDFLSNMVRMDESQYLFMRFPFVNMIPDEDMEEILRENNIAEEVLPKVMETCKSLKKDLRRSTRYHFRYLIPREELAELFAEEKIYLDTISFFCGIPLYISNERFRELIRRLCEVLEHSTTHTNIREVALLTGEATSSMRNLNILVKNNTCVSIFNDPKLLTDDVPWVLATTELPLVQALFENCHRLWETSFPQNRDRTMVARQLRIMLETIPVPEDGQCN